MPGRVCITNVDEHIDDPESRKSYRLHFFLNSFISYYSIVALTGPINPHIDINGIVSTTTTGLQINPLSIREDNQTRFSFPKRQNSRFNIYFMAYTCLLVIIILLMIAIGILSGFIIVYSNRIQTLENGGKTKVDDKEYELKYTTKILDQGSKLSNCKNKIERLNSTVVELQEQESKM